MLDYLIQLDTTIFLFFNGLHTEPLDTFMYLFSGKWIWLPMYAALLAMIARTFTLRQTIVIVLGITAVIALADQTCATLIRPFVQRLRPSNPDNAISALVHIVNGHRGGSYGFPSCHAANTFALATFMSLLVRSPRFTKAMVGWALLTCYSRIYLGVHFTGDLLVGGMIGSLIGYGVYAAVRALVLDKDEEPRRPAVVFAYPAGLLGPWMSLKVINFRYSDIAISVGALTVAYIILRSLL